MIIKALVKRQAKVKNRKLGERLAKMEAKSSLADRLVALEVDVLADDVCMVKTEGLVATVAYKVKQVDVQSLFDALAEVDAETLIYAKMKCCTH